MNLKKKFTVERALYFHTVTYSVLTTVLLMVQDVYHLILEPKLFLQDYVNPLLSCISLISVLVVICSSLVLIRCIRNRCRKTLRLVYRLTFIWFFVNLMLKEIKTARWNEQDPKTILKYYRYWHFLQAMYNFGYVLYGSNLLHFFEKLNREEQGFTYTQRVFGIKIGRIMYIHLVGVVVLGILRVGFPVQMALFSWDDEKSNEERNRWLAEILLGMIGIFNEVLMYLGIRKRHAKLIQCVKYIDQFILATYILIQVFMTTPVLEELTFLSLTNDIWKTLMLHSIILEYFLFYLYAKRFRKEETEYLHTDSEAQAYRFKLFLKTEKIIILPVKIDESETGYLGHGQFGRVRKGHLTSRNMIFSSPKTTEDTVAVKFYSGDFASEENLKSIISETKALKAGNIGHPNIVKFLGMTFNGSKSNIEGVLGFGIVMEYCSMGSLQTYQRKLRTDSTAQNSFKPEISQLNHWALEIASAMEYLSTLKLVHGDLATRNVLLDCNKSAKISDFGMSSRLYYYQLYVKKSLSVSPWRWMAPESLKDFKFSVKSDVWSYGVLLWEMFTLGQIPWAGWEWSSDFVVQLKSGIRLNQPDFATDSLYRDVFLRCWSFEPNERLDFTEIRSFFSKLVNN